MAEQPETSGQRAIKALEILGFKKRAVAEQLGMQSSALSKIATGKQVAPEKLLTFLAERGIWRPWLERGQGKMLAAENPHNDVISGRPSFTHEADGPIELQVKERQLPYLPQGPVDSDVHRIASLIDLPFVELPFVSVKARAGFTELGGINVDPRAFDTVRLTVLTEEEREKYRGAAVFEVDGDSMEDRMNSGDRIIAWQVPEGRWDQLHNVICVVAYDDTVTIKAIRGNDLFTRNALTLHALNEKGGYFTVQRQQIHSIWNALEFFDRPKIRL